jgi:hypothetical protein
VYRSKFSFTFRNKIKNLRNKNLKIKKLKNKNKNKISEFLTGTRASYGSPLILVYLSGGSEVVEPARASARVVVAKKEPLPSFDSL